jgi:hypothetical protein
MAANSWRRNPWVWLVIAIPAATVIGCLITIYLAISNPYTIVTDATSNSPAARGSVASRPV